MHFLENLSGTKKAYLIFLVGVIQLIALHFILSPGKNIDNEKSSAEVTIYFADNISPAQQDLIEKFNSLHKGKIKVELLNIPLKKYSSNERKQLFVKYLRSESERIDVFAIDQVWIPRFAKWCEPLDKFFTSGEVNKILDITKDICYYKNDFVVIPEYIDIGVMYYREDLLEKRKDYKELKEKLLNSITWNDFIKLGKEFTGTDTPFYSFPADNYEGLLCSFSEVYYNNNNSLKNSMQFLSDLVNKYKISPAEVTEFQENNITRFFLDRNGIFMRGWPNTFSYPFTDPADSNKIKRLVMVPLPHPADGKKAFILGGWNLMLSKYSKHKEEAAEFMKFWLQESSQEKMFSQNHFLPSTKKFYENSVAADKFGLRFYNSILPNAILRPKSENYTTYSNVISYYLKGVIKNEISVDRAVERAENELKSTYTGIDK